MEEDRARSGKTAFSPAWEGTWGSFGGIRRLSIRTFPYPANHICCIVARQGDEVFLTTTQQASDP